MKIFTKPVIILSLLITSGGIFAQKPVSLGEKNQIVLDIDMHPEGKQAATAQDNNIVIWDLESKIPLQKLTEGHKSLVTTINYDHTGKRIVSGSKMGRVVVWDLPAGQKRVAFEGSGLITAVKFHPGGEMVAAALASGQVIVWNIKSGEIIYNLSVHRSDVTCIDFNQDGTLLASGSADQTIALWDMTSGEIVKRLQQHKNWIRDVSFDESGKSLVSAGDDGKLIIWTISDLQNIRANIEHRLTGGDWLLCTSYMPENTITLGSRKGQILVKTKFGSYKYKAGVPVHDVVLVPDAARRVIALAATHGKGLMLIDAGLMKFKNK